MGFEHTIQGEVVILLVASCQGNWVRSGSEGGEMAT